MTKTRTMPVDESVEVDAVERARQLPDDFKTQGSRLFETAGDIFDKISPTLQEGVIQRPNNVSGTLHTQADPCFTSAPKQCR